MRLPSAENTTYYLAYIRIFLTENESSMSKTEKVNIRKCVSAFKAQVNVLYILHDDVITWKRFPHYGPFVLGIHPWRVVFLHERPVIWSFGAFLVLMMNKLLKTHTKNSRVVVIWNTFTLKWYQANDIPAHTSFPSIETDRGIEGVLCFSLCTDWTEPQFEDTTILESSVTQHLLYSCEFQGVRSDIKGGSSEETSRGDGLALQELDVCFTTRGELP